MMNRRWTNHGTLKAHQRTFFIILMVNILCRTAVYCTAQPVSAICKFLARSPVASFNNSSAARWQRRAPKCSELSDGIVLNWGISGQRANAVITFVVRAQVPAGTRYFGIGLSDLGSMKGADIFLFRARYGGGKGPIWSLTDAYADGFQQPIADEQQDLTLLGVHYGNNTLTAAWQRYVTPCDKKDIPIPATVPIYVLWAHATKFAYHGPTNRGSRAVDFFQVASKITTGAAVTTQQQQEDLQVVEWTIPVAIPNKENYYVYQYFELPSDKKYHIVRTETVKGSNLLHHGLVYSCGDIQATNVTQLPSKGPFPGLETTRLCHQVYISMTRVPAVGITQQDRVWVTPPDVGLPMGTAETRVIAVELHYYNPQLLAGQTDPGSGLKVYYTSKLRKHDLAMILLNQPWLTIPPGQASVPAKVSVCPTQCTSKRLNQSITLVGGRLHMHGLGKSGIVRRFRGSKELPPLDQLHSFDYNYHDLREFSNPETLLPGDALTLQCMFDSTGRTNVTTWGPGTLDEMCNYFLLYYPAQDGMGYCGSLGTTSYAICDNGPPPELTLMAYQKASEEAMYKKGVELIAQGKLTPISAPDPATGPFEQACKTKM
jgi:hypothetical protein